MTAKKTKVNVGKALSAAKKKGTVIDKLFFRKHAKKK